MTGQSPASTPMHPAPKKYAHYTLVGYFKNPTVDDNGEIRYKFTWRSDLQLNRLQKQGFNIFSELHALAFILKLNMPSLANATIYDNTEQPDKQMICKCIPDVSCKTFDHTPAELLKYFDHLKIRYVK
jgi:hypothetical protein